MKPIHYLVAGMAALAVLFMVAANPPAARTLRPSPPRPPKAPLPLPHKLTSPEYQKLLYPFLASREYIRLGWARDKRVRDTGPFIEGKYYGTHNAVRIFYSPEVIEWMTGGRKGRIPDGAMIIKEMFNPPAARWDSTTGAKLDSSVSGWAVMVRDSIGSKDGWYWSYYGPGQAIDNPAKYPYDYPNSDFGEYCVRCHASAQSEFTFSALKNIEGFPGDPITFRVDNSWLPNNGLPMTSSTAPKPDAASVAGQGHGNLATADLRNSKERTRVKSSFARHYDMIPPLTAEQIQHIPPLTYDHVIVGPGGPEQFVTSDQCLSCHDGQPPNLGPNMFIPTTGGNGINLSPYGEWNWSMMGLAGRDPIFYAQLESEIALQPKLSDSIQNLCFRCHGVMGDRQLAIDHPGTLFNKEMTQIVDPNDPYVRYGALARDGISCMVCHQIVDDKKPLDQIFTGQFEVSRPGEFEPGISYVYGPFEKPVELAMKSSLGIKPVQSDYIKSSRLCGSCHTVYLPVYDKNGTQVGNFFEQATYLEWQNSAFQTEFGSGGATPKSCQNCHMPTRFPDDSSSSELTFRIANIQDQTYPEADHRAPLSEITVPMRAGVARHTLLGVNQFALEMFRQFDDILGVRTTDYMTGSKNGLPFAIAQSDYIAKRQTARVEIVKSERSGGKLRASVKVTNLTGHRLPSGVGFRRAFLALRVLDRSGREVWASGRTNDLGIIVDEHGKALPSESFAIDPKTGRQRYEPHYQTITRQNQAQIYEELIKNPEGVFTTSFIALADVVKDNRLLPLGWTKNGPAGFKYQEATMPHGNVMQDAGFLDGSGSDVVEYLIDLPAALLANATVEATLYYQSIPPAYLHDRFTIAPNGKGTQRLHYLASNLNLAGTNIENWKLVLGTARTIVR